MKYNCRFRSSEKKLEKLSELSVGRSLQISPNFKEFQRLVNGFVIKNLESSYRTMLGEGMCRTSGELVPGYQLSLESIRLYLLDEIPLDVRHHGRGQLAWLVKQESNLNVIVVPPKL